MDPDANLKEQLRLVAEIRHVWDGCGDGTLTPEQAENVADKADRLADLIAALDEWVAKGGFLPKRWQK